MEKITKKYNVGFTLNLEKNDEKDLLYKYFINLDRTEFIQNCDRFIKNVREEQEKTRKELMIRISKLENEKGENE